MNSALNSISELQSVTFQPPKFESSISNYYIILALVFSQSVSWKRGTRKSSFHRSIGLVVFVDERRVEFRSSAVPGLFQPYCSLQLVFIPAPLSVPRANRRGEDVDGDGTVGKGEICKPKRIRVILLDAFSKNPPYPLVCSRLSGGGVGKEGERTGNIARVEKRADDGR